MRGRHLRIDWRPEDTPEALHAAYRAERDPAIKPRLHALWLLRTEHRMVEVAAQVGFVYRTVQKWLDHYRTGGLAALRVRPTPPPPRGHLTEAQWEAVRAHLREGTTRTVEQLRRWILQQWAVPWSYEGLREALHRHRLRLKVPRPRHQKTDRAAQQVWKGGASRATSARRSPVRSPRRGR